MGLSSPRKEKRMPIYRIAATVEVEIFAEHQDDDSAIEAVERLLDERRGQGIVPGSFRVESADELDPEDLPAETRVITFLGGEATP